MRGRLDDTEISSQVKVPEIDPVHLIDPVQPTEVYVGRGSFSVVSSIVVAVKEFLPRSVREDVKNEANILSLLSLLTHPMCLEFAPDHNLTVWCYSFME